MLELRHVICDADTAAAETFGLLTAQVDRRTLAVVKHPERPIEELIFCFRKCEFNPTDSQKLLVAA